MDGDPRPRAGGQPVNHVDVLLDVEDNVEAEHATWQGARPAAARVAGNIGVEGETVAKSGAGLHCKITKLLSLAL